MGKNRLRKKIIKTSHNEISTTYSYYDKVKDGNVKALNYLVNRIKNHDGSEEIISYDENDSIIKRVLIKNDLVMRINNYSYDSFNRLIEEIRYEVDSNSNMLSETRKQKLLKTPIEIKTVMQFKTKNTSAIPSGLVNG